MRTFTLNRQGEFRLNKAAPNQCKAPGHRHYKYALRVTTTEQLDQDGFVIDHRILHNRLRRAIRSDSCENIAKLIEQAVLRTLARHGAVCLRMYVRVEPKLPAGMQPLAIMELEATYT